MTDVVVGVVGGGMLALSCMGQVGEVCVVGYWI